MIAKEIHFTTYFTFLEVWFRWEILIGWFDFFLNLTFKFKKWFIYKTHFFRQSSVSKIRRHILHFQSFGFHLCSFSQCVYRSILKSNFCSHLEHGIDSASFICILWKCVCNPPFCRLENSHSEQVNVFWTWKKAKL